MFPRAFTIALAIIALSNVAFAEVSNVLASRPVSNPSKQLKAGNKGSERRRKLSTHVGGVDEVVGHFKEFDWRKEMKEKGHHVKGGAEKKHHGKGRERLRKLKSQERRKAIEFSKDLFDKPIHHRREQRADGIWG